MDFVCFGDRAHYENLRKECVSALERRLAHFRLEAGRRLGPGFSQSCFLWFPPFTREVLMALVGVTVVGFHQRMVFMEHCRVLKVKSLELLPV